MVLYVILFFLHFLLSLQPHCACTDWLPGNSYSNSNSNNNGRTERNEEADRWKGVRFNGTATRLRAPRGYIIIATRKRRISRVWSPRAGPVPRPASFLDRRRKMNNGGLWFFATPIGRVTEVRNLISHDCQRVPGERRGRSVRLVYVFCFQNFSSENVLEVRWPGSVVPAE